jgi:hypothetical protein
MPYVWYNYNDEGADAVFVEDQGITVLAVRKGIKDNIPKLKDCAATDLVLSHNNVVLERLSGAPPTTTEDSLIIVTLKEEAAQQQQNGKLRCCFCILVFKCCFEYGNTVPYSCIRWNGACCCSALC